MQRPTGSLEALDKNLYPNIFRLLDQGSVSARLSALSLTSKRLHTICNNDAYWLTLLQQEYPDYVSLASIHPARETYAMVRHTLQFLETNPDVIKAEQIHVVLASAEALKRFLSRVHAGGVLAFCSQLVSQRCQLNADELALLITCDDIRLYRNLWTRSDFLFSMMLYFNQHPLMQQLIEKYEALPDILCENQTIGLATFILNGCDGINNADITHRLAHKNIGECEWLALVAIGHELMTDAIIERDAPSLSPSGLETLARLNQHAAWHILATPHLYKKMSINQLVNLVRLNKAFISILPRTIVDNDLLYALVLADVRAAIFVFSTELSCRFEAEQLLELAKCEILFGRWILRGPAAKRLSGVQLEHLCDYHGDLAKIILVNPVFIPKMNVVKLLELIKIYPSSARVVLSHVEASLIPLDLLVTAMKESDEVTQAVLSCSIFTEIRELNLVALVSHRVDILQHVLQSNNYKTDLCFKSSLVSIAKVSLMHLQCLLQHAPDCFNGNDLVQLALHQHAYLMLILTCNEALSKLEKKHYIQLARKSLKYCKAVIPWVEKNWNVDESDWISIADGNIEVLEAIIVSNYCQISDDSLRTIIHNNLAEFKVMLRSLIDFESAGDNRHAIILLARMNTEIGEWIFTETYLWTVISPDELKKLVNDFPVYAKYYQYEQMQADLATGRLTNN